MEYQQLPPVSMIIGSPNTVPHVHAMNVGSNANGNGNNHISSNQLLTMQPPLLPLQAAHNLHQLTTHNSQSNNVHHGNNNQNQSSQSLPPTAQLLQAIHNNTQQQQQQQQPQQQQQQQNMSSNTNGAANNNTNSTNDENNRWTQYQVQQLWRHHAYLNGNVMRRGECLRGKSARSVHKSEKEKLPQRNFRTRSNNDSEKMYIKLVMRRASERETAETGF
jgi:hypothetical protein